MRQVVFEKETSIKLSELNDAHIVGIELTTGEKCKVLKVDDNFYVLDVIGSDNLYKKLVKANSIENVIKSLKACISSILEFDSPKDLLKWLSE